MQLTLDTVHTLWQKFTTRAKTLVLEGVVTLADAIFITNTPAMNDQHLSRWLQRNRLPRHQWLTKQQPWLDRVAASIDEVIDEMRELLHASRSAVQAFLEGRLTLVQARYAGRVHMGKRSVRYFTELNDRLAVRERRAARREEVSSRLHRRAQEALDRLVRMGRMEPATAEALRRQHTPPEGILVYAQARMVGPGNPGVSLAR